MALRITPTHKHTLVLDVFLLGDGPKNVNVFGKSAGNSVVIQINATRSLSSFCIPRHCFQRTPVAEGVRMLYCSPFLSDGALFPRYLTVSYDWDVLSHVVYSSISLLVRQPDTLKRTSCFPHESVGLRVFFFFFFLFQLRLHDPIAGNKKYR